MTPQPHLDPHRKHDFVLMFDVVDGNPNGDPDAGNMPRVDPETMQGLVSDGALKRKIRDFVALDRAGEERFEIYVREDVALHDIHREVYDELKLKLAKKDESGDNERVASKRMAERFFDVRMFGAVMSTGDRSCGQVRGPVQLTWARSVDPVLPSSATITRIARTDKADGTTMGQKHLIPYGLYVAHGFFSAHLAGRTGVTGDDMGELWRALQMMFEHDRSAARGTMSTRGLYVFTHTRALGDAPAHRLFDLVKVERVNRDAPPRSFSDYRVSVDACPPGVQLTQPEDAWDAIDATAA